MTMTELQFFNIALSLVATLFGMLIMIFGWLGNKIYTKLDTLSDKMDQIETELHEKIMVLDRRVTRLEALHEAQEG